MAKEMDDPLEKRRSRMRDKLNQQKEQPSGPPRRRPTAKKENDSLFGKRAMALAMLAPMLLPVLPAVMQVFGGGFKQFRRTKRYRNVFLLILAGLFVCALVKQFRSSLKYVGLFFALILIYPSWQVYQCSPRHINNSELGTLFSVKLNGQALMDDAFYMNDCVTRQMRGPLSLAIINPSVTIETSPEDLISLDELDITDNDNNDDTDVPPAYQVKRYLLTSKRSVSKVIHQLSMIVECPYKFNALDDALQVDASVIFTSKLSITGRTSNLKGEQFQLKKHLEKMNYIVRPLVFEVTKAMFVEGDPMPETDESKQHNKDE